MKRLDNLVMYFCYLFILIIILIMIKEYPTIDKNVLLTKISTI